MVDRGQAREQGQAALASLRRTLEERAAELIRGDPERAASAAEVGIIDRDWLERPGDHPIRTATSVEVVQRFLERSVEQRPSALATMGLTAIQVLSWDAPAGLEGDDGAPVAIVFTDLEGFTGYTQTHGDDAALSLIDQHNRVVGPVIRSRGGRVVKRLGDGLLLSFPTAEAAVLAAMELVEAVREPLALRAGVHAGEAVVTRDDLMGHSVNIAARITEQASGGEVLISDEVRDQAGELSGLSYGRAKRARLKGVSDTVRVCRVSRPD